MKKVPELIRKWQAAEKRADAARQRAEDAKSQACLMLPPTNLRPATALDVVVGAILWYPEHGAKDAADLEQIRKEGPDYWYEAKCWHIVDEVRRPSDPWKAFVDDTGCNIGLHGAFVEI